MLRNRLASKGTECQDALTQLQQTNAELGAQAAESSAHIQVLQQKLVEKNAELASQASMQLTNAGLEAQAAESSAHIQVLQTHLEEMNAELASQASEQETNAELEAQAAESSAHIQVLQQQLEEKDAQLASQASELSSNGQDAEDVTMMRTAMTELHHQNSELEAHAAEMTSAAQHAAAHVQELQQKLEEKNASLASQASELRAKGLGAEELALQNNQGTLVLQNSLKQMQLRNEELATQAASVERTNGELQAHAGEMAAAVQQAAAHVQALQQQIEDKTTQLASQVSLCPPMLFGSA